jgi:NAD(P)H dehydrogenase (quinone)
VAPRRRRPVGSSAVLKQALLVVANPSPDSFSHAMTAAAGEALSAGGCERIVHDLYAERFDPVQPAGEASNRTSSDRLVEAHARELARADLVLVFHPNWWGQPPAIMKGWIDRVFRPGLAYDYPQGVGPEGVPLGLLRARCAVVFNTSNTLPQREAAAFGDPLENLWKNCVFRLCGVEGFERRTFGPIAGSTAAVREAWLREVREVVSKVVLSPAK